MKFQAADGSLHSVSTLNTIQAAINQKTNVRETVFRDPNPPTMDMDTYLELERKRGGIVQPTPPEPTDEERAAKQDEDQDEHDKTQLKARKWDDWKDDHEKGAGNKIK